VNKAIAKAKKEYYSKKLRYCAGDTKKTWSILNEVMGRNKKDSVRELTIDGIKVCNEQTIAENFNTFFSNIGASIASAFTNDERYTQFLTDSLTHEAFEFCEFSLHEVTDIIGKLKSSTAGHDNIPMSLFHKNLDLLGQMVLNICNRSLTEGIFPNDLKVAKVIPIFKAGEKDSMNNYRPISILPAFSKILEKIVYIQLTDYFNHYKLLTPAQFGFRSGFSTECALHTFLDHVYRSLDNAEFTVCIMLDLSKAFDTLNRDILINKLEYYGIRGVAKAWFISYFAGRTQFTQVKNSRSAKLPIDSGVAQGSIIAPLLFIIYINDLVISSRVLRYVLYADDTSVFHSSKNITSLIDTVNSEMRKVCKWFEVNHLLLNASKTSFMIFHRRKQIPQSLPEITVNGNVINRVVKSKFLGIVVDDHITFRDHIDYSLSKLSKYVYIVYKIRKFIPTKELIQIYYSLVYPHFIYGISVWGGCYTTTMKPLKVLQNRLMRAISGADYRSSAEPIYERFNLLKIEQICRYITGAYVFKSLNSSHPSIFEPRNQSMHFTRESTLSLLTVPRVLTTHTSQSIRVAGPKIFNSIPSCIRESTSYNSFKLRYKHHLRSGGV